MGIQRALASETIEHLCDAPFIPETLEKLRCAGSDEHIVVGAGGLLMDYFTPFWEGLASMPDRRFSVWGVGLVDLKRKSTRAPLPLLRRVLAGAEVCVVRDDHTREVLRVPRTEVVPCPSMLAVQPRSSAGVSLLHSVNYTTVGADVYRRMVEILREQAEGLGYRYREVNNRIEAGRRRELQDVVNAYAEAEIVISSRLHGCIIAVALGRPVIAVSGDWKIEAFMSAAGLGSWVLAQEEVGRLPEMLARVELQPDVSGFVAQSRERNLEVGRRLREMLG